MAIVREESDAPGFAAALVDSPQNRMSAATWLESAIVIDGARDPLASRRYEELIRRLQIEVVPVTIAQAERARQAYLDFSKGNGSRARLNFGDCVAYALAADTREPLLFKGGDFVHTNATSARRTVR